MRLRSALVLMLAGWLAFSTATPAWTLSQPHPQPSRDLTIRGFLKGRLGEDRDVRLALTATHPDGWFRLESLIVALTLHGQSIQEISFDVQDQSLVVGGRPPAALRPDTPRVAGSFVGVEPARTRLIRSTFSIRLELRLFSTADIPNQAIFRMTALDDAGNGAEALRRPQFGRGLLSWGTLGLAVALALFIGAFAGNTFSTRRYRHGEPSIWDILERRLKEQNARPPALVASEAGGVG
jgi:hypothetical protein